MSIENKKNRPIKPISARTILLPAAISVTVIIVAMAVFVHTANTLNKILAQKLRDSEEYVEKLSDFMGGSSMLNETSASFIVNPVDEEGNVIWGQIMPYAVELSTEPRRAEDLLAFFADYDIGDETLEYINEACDDARFFISTQKHAIALVTSVYPLPSMQDLEPVLNLEISEEEAKMPEQARLGLAKSLILNAEYASHRKSLASAVNNAIASVKESSSIEIEKTNREVNLIVTLLWVSVSLMFVILAVTFIVFYRFLVYPLTRASKIFSRDKKLNEHYGLKEFRIAAESYNSLMERRNSLEAIMKKTAETDVLTSLPNRYAFETFIRSLENESPIFPICYYSLDLNYLKHTNDTYGHLSGDKLLEGAARAIKESFGENCFRVGGDEFAAFIFNYDEEKASEIEAKFISLQEKEGVSISYGSSVTNNLNAKTIDQVMVEADNIMYERKRILHAKEKENASDPKGGCVS